MQRLDRDRRASLPDGGDVDNYIQGVHEDLTRNKPGVVSYQFSVSVKATAIARAWKSGCPPTRGSVRADMSGRWRPPPAT
jgi:hypothetical protein